MKYLKLFEDHKETSDKISEIEKSAQKQTDEVINGYKELIDEMMYEISDDYETESLISIKDVEHTLDRYVKTYIDYKIEFSADKYEDVLDKLFKVVNRLKEAYDISYNINGIYDVMTGRLIQRTFDFLEVKTTIKNYIDRNSRTNPSDIKLKFVMSF